MYLPGANLVIMGTSVLVLVTNSVQFTIQHFQNVIVNILYLM